MRSIEPSDLKATLERALDLVVPPVCLACEAPVARTAFVCGTCWADLRFIERPFCEVLGTPFSYDLGPGALSADAIASPPPFRRARAALAYGDVAAGTVARLKYSDRTDLAPWMAGLMVRPARELAQSGPLVVAVPLHRRRLVARAANQAAELARPLASQLGLALRGDLLERRRATRSQVGLARKARARNVAGAFEVPAPARPLLAGRDVLLVDDVFTTGATLAACARALKRGGAANVDCITFARVVADWDAQAHGRTGELLEEEASLRDT